MSELDNENNQVVQESEATHEPADLAEAFRMFNKANAAPAESNVEPAEPEQPAEPELSATPDVVPPEPDRDGDLGGSPDVVQPIDYNPARKQVLDNVQRQALQRVRDEYKKQGINLVSIKDLYEQDQNSGRVTFKNPDDPRSPFSSRAEAQSWCDAFNKQVNEQFRRDVNAAQSELLKDAMPSLRLLDFAATYNSMNKQLQEVFDDLIEPYSMRDNNGKIIGFSCDLERMAKQAEKIISRFSTPQPATPQATEPVAKENSGPALDMKAGNSLSSDSPEPKTIGEALKMFDKQQREKKGKK